MGSKVQRSEGESLRTFPPMAGVGFIAMKKQIFRVICLGVFFSLPVVAIGWSTEFFSPSWKVGDTWVVKAVYPDPFENGKWSSPVFWEYEVAREESLASGNCVIIEVLEKTEKEDRQPLRLTYRLKDHRLLRAEITKTRQGKESLIQLTYEGEYPVETQQSPVPFDSPVFPLRIPSSVMFSIQKDISGGLKKTEPMRQVVQKVHGLAESADVPGEYNRKELIRVQCEDAQGNVIFSQYWDETSPWPVYGSNVNMKYWLMLK